MKKLLKVSISLLLMLSILMVSSISVYADTIKVYLCDYSDVTMTNKMMGSVTDALNPKVIKRKELKFDVKPVIINDRTYVPIRKVVDALGYDVSWDGENRTVILTTVIDTSNYLSNIQHRNMINLLIDLENGGNQSFGRLNQTFNGFTTIDYALENYSKIKIDIRMHVGSCTSIIKAIPYKRSEGDARGYFVATHESDVSSIIKNGRTLIPLRAVSELLGLFIDWDGDTSTVTISGLPIQ